MAGRREARPALPWTHPRRWTWIHGLAFALCVFLAAFLVLWGVGLLLAEEAAAPAGLPQAFLATSLAAAIGTVVLCTVLVLGYMARGINLMGARARGLMLVWSGCGLLFALVQSIVLAKFGRAALPHVAPWASNMYWQAGLLGLPTFGLMTWIHAATAHAATSVVDDPDHEAP